MKVPLHTAIHPRCVQAYSLIKYLIMAGLIILLAYLSIPFIPQFACKSRVAGSRTKQVPVVAKPTPVIHAQVKTQDKLVWVHAMKCFPLDTSGPIGYSNLYPLIMGPGVKAQTEIEAAVAAGVDGFFVDVFTGVVGPYYDGADKSPGFLIAPCLDLSCEKPDKKEAAALKAVIENYKEAVKHPSAAWVDGALVFFTYGTNQMPPEAWDRVRKAALAQGYKTYFVADINFGDLAVRGVLPRDEISPYLDVFEAFYIFGNTGATWDDVVQFFHNSRRVFCGGMMPGYYRNGGGYRDARATALYREEWERHLASGISWICINTWNDMAESTEILPDSDWNLTRSELTYWYAQRHKGKTVPWTFPRLYITSVKNTYLGERPLIEALVLNASDAPAKLRLAVKNCSKKETDSVMETTIAPGREGSVTIEANSSTLVAGQYLRGEAELIQKEKTVSKVSSAPILVMDPIAQSGYVKRLYYSIPALQSLSENPVLEFNGGPLRVGGKGEAKVLIDNNIKPRFTEVMQNNYLLLRNVLGSASTMLPVPAKLVGSNKTTEWGFYLGRVTDSALKVGYTDPIYVTPPSNLELLEQYTFDQGSGNTVADLSVYQKAGILKNVQWIKPGADGKGFGIHFNGVDSRVDLALEQTPLGAFTLEIKIRPNEYDGMIYCDSGGMLMILNKDGHIKFVRRGVGSGPWCSAIGKTVIPKGTWTSLRFVWNGKASQIFVNDVLDGEVNIPESAFESDRRALGCNPFGAGSAFFKGDMDDLKLKLLPSDKNDNN